jgi:hypothetical protein
MNRLLSAATFEVEEVGTMDKDEIEHDLVRVCTHEEAHAEVAEHMGVKANFWVFRTDGVAERPWTGMCAHSPTTAYNRAVICWAGVIAENKLVFGDTLEGDFSILDSVLLGVSAQEAGVSDGDLKGILGYKDVERTYRRAVELVDELWESIQAEANNAKRSLNSVKDGWVIRPRRKLRRMNRRSTADL